LKYSDEPAGTRAIIFALACTKACHTKKININNTCISKSSTAAEVRANEKTIQTLIKLASNNSNFESLSREAWSVFETLRLDTRTSTTTSLESSVVDAVRVSVGEILKPILPAPELSPSRKIARGVWDIVTDSFRHAFLVFLAGLYFIFAGMALNKAGTTVVPHLWTLAEEAFKPIQASTQDKALLAKEQSPH
jgi:hypothetical protein